jgi:hypothetical protein
MKKREKNANYAHYNDHHMEKIAEIPAFLAMIQQAPGKFIC